MKRADYALKAEDGAYRITASTHDKDRDGEIILPSSFNGSLGKYLGDNPVILWGHDYSVPPVGRATDGRISDKSLELDIEFAPTPLGQEVKSLYDGGFLNSFSVGFIPRDGKYDDEKEAFTYTDCELLEVSCVTVPSNRAATMMREAEQRGFNVPAIKKALGVVDPDTSENEVTEVPTGEVVKSGLDSVAEKYLRRSH